MAIETLAEAVAPSETWISVWHDDAEHEIYIQYGYVDISMPIEDFAGIRRDARRSAGEAEKLQTAPGRLSEKLAKSNQSL
jgi:hypothetical protein